MASFEINKPITTRESTIAVDARLPIGRHRFRLDVIGRENRRSSVPDEAVVEVQAIVIDTRPPIGPAIDPRPAVITRPADSPRPRGRARRKKEKP